MVNDFQNMRMVYRRISLIILKKYIGSDLLTRNNYKKCYRIQTTIEQNSWAQKNDFQSTVYKCRCAFVKRLSLGYYNTF